jgi:glycosyltransferase involved in cell wall biosynthesis
VIPTRDRWALLQRALASANGQEGVDLEIIIVDDGSTDGTPPALAALLDRRVRVLRTGGGRGPSVARNAGIAAATGAWTAFLDDDDQWAPAKLSAQISTAEASGAVFAYAAALHVDRSGRVLAKVEAPPPADLATCLRARNVIPAAASNVLVRTNVLRSLGGFDEALWHFSDWDLWLRLARSGRGAAVPEPLVAYLQHPGNLRSRGTVGLMRELSRLDAIHDGGSPRDPERRLLLRWISGAHRDSGHRVRAAAVDVRIGIRHGSPPDLARGLLTLVSPRGERWVRARLQGHAPALSDDPPAWVSETEDER